MNEIEYNVLKLNINVNYVIKKINFTCVQTEYFIAITNYLCDEHVVSSDFDHKMHR